MKNQRLKQLSLSFCVVLSLLISSLSICACAHRPESNSAESSCHAGLEMSGEMTMHDESNQQDSIQNVISENAHCNCLQTAPKVFSKSELLKIEKQTAEIPAVIVFTVKQIPEIPAVNSANFENPFYLSDSSYNIKSPRAPPRS